jgi:alpha-tubulin suppressor-like RCC1 family protein
MPMHPRLTLPVVVSLLASPACREGAEPTGPADAAQLQATVTQPFIQISAGSGHACGVTADNRAYCWGENAFGNLGDGTFTTRLAPTPVAGGLRFVEVRAATTHTCGLTTDGRAFCWGANDIGQQGNGSLGTAQQVTPGPVAGNRRFTQIRVGFRHSCALTAAGAAFCWGDNGAGQLGTGSATGPADCGGFGCSARPVRAAGPRTFIQIRPGGEHTCGLTADRRTWCWGNNFFGQLGSGDTASARPAPMMIRGNHRFLQLSAGGTHTCGVDSDHQAWCWGRNARGQVGDGSTVQRRLVPTLVAGGLSFNGVSAGVEHSCGNVTTGEVYCWGSNTFGQLGDGTTTPRRAPRQVASDLRWDLVVGGWQLSCAITRDDRTFCWGEHTGDGTSNRRLTPVRVANPS